jgi:hypothetical protein
MREERIASCKDGERKKPMCVYQWVASPGDAKGKEIIAERMQQVLTNNEGWEAYGYPVRQPRRTWLGWGLNATFTVQLDNLAIPVEKMMVLYLKSYGKDWADVRLSLLVEGSKDPDVGEWVVLHEAILEGFHDSQTSINYSHRTELGNFLQTGSSVRATFTIINGARFQVNGLAFCGLSNQANTASTN